MCQFDLLQNKPTCTRGENVIQSTALREDRHSDPFSCGKGNHDNWDKPNKVKSRVLILRLGEGSTQSRKTRRGFRRWEKEWGRWKGVPENLEHPLTVVGLGRPWLCLLGLVVPGPLRGPIVSDTCSACCTSGMLLHVVNRVDQGSEATAFVTRWWRRRWRFRAWLGIISLAPTKWSRALGLFTLDRRFTLGWTRPNGWRWARLPVDEFGATARGQ